MRAMLMLAAVALTTAPACSVFKPHADPTKYFVLTSEAKPTEATAAPLVLGIAHVSLPDYLERTEMVTRTASNQLNVAPYDHWGEPLQDGFERTLRQDLEKALGAGHVLTAPFDPANRPQLTVEVQVHRFERVEGQGAVLEATWTLRDPKSGAMLLAREARAQRPVAGNDPQAAVAALSATVAALANEVAGAARAQH